MVVRLARWVSFGPIIPAETPWMVWQAMQAPCAKSFLPVACRVLGWGSTGGCFWFATQALNAEPHVRVGVAAELGALSHVLADRVGPEHDVVHVARHDVALGRDGGDPEAVNHVIRGHVQRDGPAHREMQLVGGDDALVGVAVLPPPLVPDHLDLERSRRRGRLGREDRPDGRDGHHHQDQDRRERPGDLERRVPVGRVRRRRPGPGPVPDERVDKEPLHHHEHPNGPPENSGEQVVDREPQIGLGVQGGLGEWPGTGPEGHNGHEQEAGKAALDQAIVSMHGGDRPSRSEKRRQEGSTPWARNQRRRGAFSRPQTGRHNVISENSMQRLLAAALAIAALPGPSPVSVFHTRVADAPGLGYYRFPALHGDSLVFTAEGDLWMVDAAGGVARRLTSGQGEETNATISPDGKTIAFVGSYEGPAEIYNVPMSGGVPVRRTWGGGLPVGWTPDGKLLMMSGAMSTLPEPRLFTLDLSTGARNAIPLVQASDGAYDRAGGTLFFTRFAFQGSHTKRYKGGTAQSLWKLPAGASEATPLTGD